jgi:ankyrin repeat protein
MSADGNESLPTRRKVSAGAWSTGRPYEWAPKPDMASKFQGVSNQKLVAAVRNGNIEEVEPLLAAGCDVNCRDARACTPLIAVCSRDFSDPDALARSIEMIDVLVKANALVDYQSSGCGGWNAIMAAAYSGNAVVVGKLIEAGAKTNAVDSGGNSALEIATRRGHREVMQLLDDNESHPI